MVKVPEQAVWFGLETEGEDGWDRVDHAELGGRWWRTAAVDPAELAAQIDPEGVLTFRAIFTPTDRRKSLGESLPFSAEAKDDDEDEEDEAAPVAQPRRPPRPARTQQPRPPNGSNGGAPPTPADAMRRHPPQIAPVVPLPPNADHHLMTFWTLQQLAQTQADRLISLIMVQHQAAIESERARSRETIEQTRQFFGSVERNQRELQAALMAAGKNDQTPVAVHQLQQHIQAQSAALVAMGEKLDELEQDDGDDTSWQLPNFSDEPNNIERVFAGLQGIVGSIANSPLAEPLGEMLRRKQPPPPPQQPLPFSWKPPAATPPPPQPAPFEEEEIPGPPEQ